MPTITLLERAFALASTHKMVFGTYTGPASYVAGGDPLAPGDLKNLGEIELIVFENPASSTPACRLVKYDYTNGKVIWFDLAGAEIAGGVDLSTFSGRFVAFGK